MKRMPPKKKTADDKSLWYMVIGGYKIYHGELITALISNNNYGEDDEDEDDEYLSVTGKLCINIVDDKNRAYNGWICQDTQEGCSEAHETFGYEYSWQFKVDEKGKVCSHDTKVVKPFSDKKRIFYILIDGVLYEEGELAILSLRTSSPGSRKHDWTPTPGIINIIDDSTISFCQDIKSGKNNFNSPGPGIPTFYGKLYGWNVRIGADRKIESTDSKDLAKITKYATDKKEVPPTTSTVKQPVKPVIEEDVMPEDWVPTGKDLEFLKFIQQ